MNNSAYVNPYHKPQLPEIDPQLNPAYNFNNLIEGNSNKLARTAGMSIGNDPGKNIFNPLFVYGQSGVGKTHLANAIGVMTKQLHPEKRVLYVSANTFQIQQKYENSVEDYGQAITLLLKNKETAKHMPDAHALPISFKFVLTTRTPTYRGLSAVSRDLLDTADKPRYVGAVEQMSTDPNIYIAYFL